jgi:chromosome segregation ATPase
MNAQPAPSQSAGAAQPDQRLRTAVSRLRRAIDTLEAATQRQDRAQSSAASLEQELEVLFEDRSRLAQELDHVKARASRLDAASAEVSGRLDTVMTSLRSALAGN